jgi:uncharacterized membrane protein
MKNEKWTLAKTAIVSALIGLACLGTLLIRIPIPATTGYFNLGDIFVILAGLWLGPLGGFLVGSIGPSIADAIGFPQFILATFVTKGLEGLIVGVVAGGFNPYSIRRRTVGAFAGGFTVVVGYFVFEAYVYPALGRHVPFFAVTDIAAAIVEFMPNTIQGAIGAVGGLALWKSVSGFNPSNVKKESTENR